MVVTLMSAGEGDEVCNSFEEFKGLKLNEYFSCMSWFGKTIMDPGTILANVFAFKGRTSTVSYESLKPKFTALSAKIHLSP